MERNWSNDVERMRINTRTLQRRLAILQQRLEREAAWLETGDGIPAIASEDELLPVVGLVDAIERDLAEYVADRDGEMVAELERKADRRSKRELDPGAYERDRMWADTRKLNAKAEARKAEARKREARNDAPPADDQRYAASRGEDGRLVTGLDRLLI